MARLCDLNPDMRFATVVTIGEGKFFLHFTRHQEAGLGLDTSEFPHQSLRWASSRLPSVLSTCAPFSSQPAPSGVVPGHRRERRSAPEKKIGT